MYFLDMLHFLWRIVYSIDFYLLIKLYILLVFYFLSSSIDFILILCQMGSWQRFSPFSLQSPPAGNCFLCSAEVFNLMQSYLSILTLFSCAIGVLL
jgi:hypothetical protein